MYFDNCRWSAHNQYRLPELPTTVVEAWYCYCSEDSVIMDLHVFWQLSLVSSQSLSAPWASHYSSGGLVLLLLSGLHHYGSILSTVVGWLTVIFSVPELPTTVAEDWYCYCSVDHSICCYLYAACPGNLTLCLWALDGAQAGPPFSQFAETGVGTTKDCALWSSILYHLEVYGEFQAMESLGKFLWNPEYSCWCKVPGTLSGRCPEKSPSPLLATLYGVSWAHRKALLEDPSKHPLVTQVVTYSIVNYWATSKLCYPR